MDSVSVDHRAAVRAWAEEFAAEHGLGSEGVSWLLTVTADYSGPTDRLFLSVRDEIGPDLATWEAPDLGPSDPVAP